MTDPTYADLFSEELSYLRQEHQDDSEGLTFEEYVVFYIYHLFKTDDGVMRYPEGHTIKNYQY